MSYQQKIDEARQRVAAARASGELSQEPLPEDESENATGKQKRLSVLEGAAIGIGMAGLVAVLGVLFFLLIVISSLCIICK
ncbi:hypothetical protein ACEN8I_00030 [Polaromonas sp. CT11-55]|uniref:hypothetical protein n=1 Tax=Polaromonas sp. CT11-55 TaxID=3243045 RepID=UPI0039A72645